MTPFKSSICSYSFHRMLDAGKMDFLRYVQASRELGCTHLQPWNVHFARSITQGQATQVGHNPNQSAKPDWLRAPTDPIAIAAFEKAVVDSGLPVEMIAVDGAHIYDDDSNTRAANRHRAYDWIDFAARLKSGAVRIDSGGPHVLQTAHLDCILDGYHDLVAYAGKRNMQVVIENHWGASQIPENILTFLDAVPGLGYLFDTNNWAEGRKADGWKLCADRATATHVKTFAFGPDGNETTVDLVPLIQRMAKSGYKGIWGVESVPRDGDEMQGARQTLALIERALRKS